MSKVKDEHLIEIAQHYNNHGRMAAYELLAKYSIKYPSAVIKRLKNHSNFTYDKDRDCFMFDEKATADDVFMSMEDLCAPDDVVKAQRHISKVNGRSEAMEKLIHDLLGDRLLELSRYITLESASKTMIIDQTSIKNAGYVIITH
jgi:hypothetical protein